MNKHRRNKCQICGDHLPPRPRGVWCDLCRELRARLSRVHRDVEGQRLIPELEADIREERIRATAIRLTGSPPAERPRRRKTSVASAEFRVPPGAGPAPGGEEKEVSHG
jgi:hypothetical protein